MTDPHALARFLRFLALRAGPGSGLLHIAEGLSAPSKFPLARRLEQLAADSLAKGWPASVIEALVDFACEEEHPLATTPTGPSLSKAQAEMLRVVVEHIDAHGYPPTLREIGRALGGRSTNAVHEMLDRLERKGVLVRDSKSSRGIRLVGRAA